MSTSAKEYDYFSLNMPDGRKTGYSFGKEIKHQRVENKLKRIQECFFHTSFLEPYELQYNIRISRGDSIEKRKRKKQERLLETVQMVQVDFYKKPLICFETHQTDLSNYDVLFSVYVYLSMRAYDQFSFCDKAEIQKCRPALMKICACLLKEESPLRSFLNLGAERPAEEDNKEEKSALGGQLKKITQQEHCSGHSHAHKNILTYLKSKIFYDGRTYGG